MTILTKAITIFTLVAMSVTSLTLPTKSYAAGDVAATQEAKVSFTFDDGFASTYTKALPILSAKNFTATIYPNTSSMQKGKQADGFPAITWAQLLELQNTYGWEVGGHTVNHVELPKLTQAQIAAELTQSKADLEANGLLVTDFASPFGAYDNLVLTEVLKYYQSHRGFADRDALNTAPYNKATLMIQDLNKATTLAQAKAWVDQAITNKQYLILVLHDVQEKTNPTYEYVWTTANLTELVNYIDSKKVLVQTVNQALAKTGTNVTANYNFASGMANWTTDNATDVTLDTNNNGAYSDPTNSIKIVGSAAGSHLFSSLISAIPGTPYLLDVFYNTLGLTAGELGFYVDEYDANGTWLTGQWLGMVANNAIGYFQKYFDAASALVSSFRIQTYLTPNSTGTAYVDNVDLRNLSATASATPTPTVTPTATPSGTPTPAVNLVQNPTFDSGLSNGWTTDKAANVSLDTANNGGAPTGQNSIKFTGSTTPSHLFYGLLPINPATNYLFSVFANATGLTSGELGFYMDEYNAAGTWISGQWLGMVTDGLSSTFNRAFKATSNLVTQVRIQTYLTANATGTAYVDNYSLTDNSAPTNVTPTPSATPSATPVPGQNLIENATFDNGLTNGWTTNNATTVKADANNNGGTPNAQNSVSMTGSPAASYLFYGLLPINPATSYMFSSFANATGLTSGELGFYMDEYDTAGNWISGQWFGMVANNISSTFTKVYKATSTLVSQVRIQTYLTANSTGTAYVDNYSFTDQAATGSATPTPTTTPSVTPTVSPTGTPSVTPTPTTTPATGTNLVQNGSFEDIVNSFAASWERDTADFTVDTTSKGNAGVNSLHVGANTNYAHAFSSKITVDPTKTYVWSQYVNVLTGLGEFGFYIDEYDAAGNWISGQWKGMISGAFAGTQTFTYTPSSSTVASVRLQYYAVPNSTFSLYLDSVSFSN